MSIATRTGDNGTTSLLFNRRVSKNHLRIQAVGGVDELNAALGFARATAPANATSDLEPIQHNLVSLMGELATADEDQQRYLASDFSRIKDSDLARLDQLVAEIESGHGKFKGWAFPGASLHAATLDLARTAARRAERHLVSLQEQGMTVRPLLLQHLNRLSDSLWLLARAAERAK